MKKSFNIFHNDYWLGRIDNSLPLEEADLFMSKLSFRNEITQQIGWEAKRYSEAFRCFEDFTRKRDEDITEEEFAQSPEYQNLERGEVGHYLFEGSYFLLDRKNEAYSIDLYGHTNGSLAFEVKNQIDYSSIVKKYEAFVPLQNLYDFSLKQDNDGPHKFGGGIDFEISNLSQAVHLTFTLDLTDLNFPVLPHKNVRKLPLLYAFNSCDDLQYEVISDNLVNIIHMEANNDEMILNSSFPEQNFSIRELSYEEKRVRALDSHESFHGLNQDDDLLRDELGGNAPLFFGGKAPYNQGKVVCLNKKCSHSEPIELFFTLIPFEINNNRDFWEEYDNEFIDICFYTCRSCNSIIVSNSCD